MDVKTLCLGVLTEGDQTGYEIKRSFEQAFNHFFSAGFGSIYPALAELTRRGLVTCRSVEQEKRPDKKVYSLTPAGHAALVAELMTTPPRHKVRSEFLVLAYFAHLLPPAQVAAIVDRMIATWEPLLAEISTYAEGEGCPAGVPATASTCFVAGFGRAVLGAALDYVQAHRRELVEGVAEIDATSEPPMALAGD